MKRIREAFATNRLAQIGAMAALDDDEFLEQVTAVNREGREYLYQEFERMELPYVKSQANFMLVDTKKDIRQVFVDLQREGVITVSYTHLDVYKRQAWGSPSSDTYITERTNNGQWGGRKTMEVYALIGSSGTGKSHHAQAVAFREGINIILDDGLLIQGSRIIAGRSAKREPTKLQAEMCIRDRARSRAG